MAFAVRLYDPNTEAAAAGAAVVVVAVAEQLVCDYLEGPACVAGVAAAVAAAAERQGPN